MQSKCESSGAGVESIRQHTEEAARHLQKPHERVPSQVLPTSVTPEVCNIQATIECISVQQAHASSQAVHLTAR